MDLNLSTTNGTDSAKIYDKRDDFEFDIVNVASVMAMSRTSHSVYISQLLRFVRAASNASDFNCRNKAITISHNKAMTSNSSNRFIIINFVRRFQSIIAGTVGCLQNIMKGW